MDYKKKTVKELRALAKQKGLKGYSTLRKDDLIALIKKGTSRKRRSRGSRKTSRKASRSRRSRGRPRKASRSRRSRGRPRKASRSRRSSKKEIPVPSYREIVDDEEYDDGEYDYEEIVEDLVSKEYVKNMTDLKRMIKTHHLTNKDIKHMQKDIVLTVVDIADSKKEFNSFPIIKYIKKLHSDNADKVMKKIKKDYLKKHSASKAKVKGGKGMYVGTAKGVSIDAYEIYKAEQVKRFL